MGTCPHLFRQNILEIGVCGTGGRRAASRGKEEGTWDQVAPAEVCHFLRLGPTSQFPKCPQIAPPPGSQAFNTCPCRERLVFKTAHTATGMCLTTCLNIHKNGKLYVMCILRQFKSVGYGEIHQKVHKDCVHWV